FIFRGKSLEELKSLSFNEFLQLLPSSMRKALKKGFTESQKTLLAKIRKNKPNIETHCREMIVIPEMVDKTIKVHNGKEFVPIMIQPDMIGHRLGEFSLTRRRIAHSAPGVGATRSSAAISVR
ncbi:30S ribosomal protein S19, partial [Candidatus Woesearchaeota archaeon]|nr:30S ribosomal protein S19 [Candidatus Woesearchaeota archaeon]